MVVPRRCVFLERDSEEWVKAWSQLEAEWGDLSQEHPTSGEVWQYMGTWEVWTDNREWRWRHDFRHRMHPSDGRRKMASYPASHGWRAPAPEMIPDRRGDFDPADCAGSFDGNQVHSDADPGL